MRLYLVRHAKPVVGPDICYGRTDLRVSPEQQARTAAALISALPKHVPMFSSPLRRCAELADGLAKELHCGTPIYDSRLAEMDFGAWEMRTWEDIGRTEIDAWADDIVEYRPGGGESVIQMAQRVRTFYEDLMRLHIQLRQDCAIVICHAGTIRLLLACQSAPPLAEMALRAAQTSHKIGYGDVLVLDC
ncbi:MAG: alpha-ribazole phosphatase [Collimonas sp.]